MTDEKNVILYERVNKREDPYSVSIKDVIFMNEDLYKELKLDFNVFAKVKRLISSASCKEEKWEAKKDNLMAFSLENTNFFVIDIDTFWFKEKEEKLRIIEELSIDEELVCIKYSISGNIFCLYETYKRLDDKDFLSAYNTKYIQVLNIVEDNVDYLPERKRLRYLTDDKIIYLNKDYEKIKSWYNFSFPFSVNNILEDKEKKKSDPLKRWGSRF